MSRRHRRTRRGHLRRAAAAALAVALVVAIGAEVSVRIWEDDLPESIQWYDAAAQRKIEQMDELGSVDVVFAGTSMAWQALDPTTFTKIDPAGRTAYNAGLAGGVPGVMEPWISAEVAPRLEPELVVWGLSTLDLAPAYGDTNITSYESAPAVSDGFMAQLDRRARSLSALVRHRRTLRDPDAWQEGGGDEPLFSAVDGILGPAGERREFDVSPDGRRAQLAATRLLDWAPSEDDLRAIRRTVEELTGRGIRVVLAPLPVPPRFVGLHPNGTADLTTFSETIDDLAADLDIDVVDVAVGYEDDDFVDYTHLDREGSVRYTRQFTAALARAENGQPEPEPWELLADVAPDGTKPTRERHSSLRSRATTVAERSVLAVENLHSALSPSQDLFGIHVPLTWANGVHRTKQLQLQALEADGAAPEVLFTGTSKVWYGIDAEHFTARDGRPSYNAGLAAAGPAAQHAWLAGEMAPLIEPELVVWGLSAYDLSGRLDGTSGRIVAAVELQEQVFEPLAWSDWMKAGLWVDRDLPPTWQISPADVGVANSGQLRTDDVDFNETLEALVTYFVGGATEADARELETIEETVAALRSEGIDVVLVSMPVPEAFRALQPEGAPDSLTGAVATTAAGLGVEHLDMSRSMDDGAFADYTHLTGSGATAFTDLLMDELDRLGKLG